MQQGALHVWCTKHAEEATRFYWRSMTASSRQYSVLEVL
jgi:hypothetical protein